MSDVSKIRIEGVTLNIKDLEARQRLNDVEKIVNAKRSFILIGDSFGGGVISATKNGVGWIQHFKEYTGNQYNVYNNQVPLGGVYGFASSRPFLDVLKDCETQIEDNNTITDIVVLGGTNDLGVNRALIEPAIKRFAEYCRANFPNALVKIGLVGTAISDLYELLPHYRTCNKYGCVFIKDTLCLMNNPALISDGTHLLQDGYDLYDPYICDAILSGSCSYKFEYKVDIVGDVILSQKPQIYVEICENGYAIQFTTGRYDTSLTNYFNVEPTSNAKFEICIGNASLPKLPVYYTRIQNGFTTEVVTTADDKHYTSNCRPFSIWFEPTGDIMCVFGQPYYEHNQTEIVTLFSETYTYLI